MSHALHRLLPTSLAAIALLGLTACDYFVSAESRIQKAQELHAKGDYRAAVIELKKVLEKHPDNRDARFHLGEVSLVAGESAAAEKELRRAQELGIPKDRVVIRLGQALLDQGQVERALQELDPAAVQDEGIRAGVFMLRGIAYLAQGKPDNAERAFRDLLALRTDSLEARVGLAGVERARGNLAGADAYIAEVLSRDPKYVRALLAKGQLEQGRGQYARAEEDFARVLELAPVPAMDEFIARSGIAECQWRQGKADLALQHVERLMKLAPQHPQPRYLRALIAYGAGDYQMAKGQLQQILRSVPDYRPAVLLLGATHYAQGELEQADMYLSNVLAADPASLPARKLLAATRLRQRKPQEAVAALTPVLAQGSGDAQLLALMGRATLQAGDAETGLLYLERGARSDPADHALQLQLAAGYASAGEADHAIKLLEKLPETQADPYGRELLLILAYLRKGDRAAALARVDKLLGSRPNDPGAYNLAGNAYMSAGQPRLAREHFEKALQLQPDNVTVLLNLGRLALVEGKQDDARARFEQVLALSATNVDAMMLLARLSALRNDQAGVKQWLERASGANPTSIQPKLLLLSHYLETGSTDQASALAADMAKAEPNNLQAQNAVGVVQMAERKYREAAVSFQRAVAAAPDSANLTYNLARAELAQGRRSEAKRALAQTLKLQPGHVQAAATLAMIEAKEGNADQALSRARDLQRDKATLTAGHALEGDLQMMQGQFDRSARAYEAASKEGESAVLAVKTYQARRQAQMPDVLKPLETWLGRHPGDVRVRIALAEAYRERGQLKQAAAQYELMLSTQPDNPVALNNLAWVYHEAKDPRALETSERAHQLQPHNGAITDTFGWLLVQEGQGARGVEVLRQAVQQAPGIPDIQYHLGAALAAQGSKDEARRVLAALVSSGASFKDAGKAKQLLEQL